MKTMTVFQARNNFLQTLKAADRDVVVVTRRGRSRPFRRSVTMTSKTSFSSARRSFGL